MRILKFGGTSMGDENTWQQVITIIRRYKRPFVIVSATARTTRQLVSAAEKAPSNLNDALQIASDIENRHRQLISNFSEQLSSDNPQLLENCYDWISKTIQQLNVQLNEIHNSGHLAKSSEDAVAATGERLSSYLFAQCCAMAGLRTRWIDATQIIRTDSDFGQANPDIEFINRKAREMAMQMEPDEIPVMGGYYGQNERGDTTTLGFEGSDYTASLIGAAVSANAIEIWTDVSGIYTCDPRYVKNARPIEQLSFQEATEMAYFGAKVLHPSTTKPAATENIPILVKNIFEPDAPGTKISSRSQSNGLAKAITFKENGVLLTITSAHTVMGYEFLAGVFDTLRYYHLSVDAVTTTEASVSIAVEDDKRLKTVADQLRSYGSVEIKRSLGIISLVGCRQHKTQHMINHIISGIQKPTIELLSFSREKGNFNLVIQKAKTVAVVKEMHRKLFE